MGVRAAVLFVLLCLRLDSNFRCALLGVSGLQWCPWRLLNCERPPDVWRCRYTEVRQCACSNGSDPASPSSSSGGDACPGNSRRRVDYLQNRRAVLNRCGAYRCRRAASRVTFCSWSQWTHKLDRLRILTLTSSCPSVMETRTRHKCCSNVDGKLVRRPMCYNARLPPDREFRRRRLRSCVEPPKLELDLEQVEGKPQIFSKEAIYSAIGVGLLVFSWCIFSCCREAYQQQKANADPTRTAVRLTELEADQHIVINPAGEPAMMTPSEHLASSLALPSPERPTSQLTSSPIVVLPPVRRPFDPPPCETPPPTYDEAIRLMVPPPHT